MCGEKYLRIAVFVLLMGSPPRMRGKVCGYFVVCRYLRITPAYAGKSQCFCSFVIICKDHPRVCGEKQGNTAAISVTPGSPPRMRGKEQKRQKTMGEYGITPAYAGKSGHRKRR